MVIVVSVAVLVACLATPISSQRSACSQTTGRVASRSLVPMFAALADRTEAPDTELPSTGVPLDRERLLSAIFIRDERYGTRCSTVLAIARDGRATFVERSFAPDGGVTGEVAERFALQRR